MIKQNRGLDLEQTENVTVIHVLNWQNGVEN